MKIIIFGANNIGRLLAETLSVKNSIMIIDNEDIPDDIKNMDIDYISGNAADINILKKYNADKCDIFIACKDFDESNILSCMMMKHLCNAKTVCFISKEEYFSSLMYIKNQKQNNEIFADYIVRPDELLTQEIFRLITVPSATQVENFGKGKARLLEYPVKENSTLLNMKIRDCKFPEEVLIVGITRSGELFIPNGDTELLLNDKLIFMGSVKQLDFLAAEVFREETKVKSVAIIGGGKTGLILAEIMEKAGIKCKIIEINLQRCEHISEILRKTLVINGDGTDVSLLSDEQIEDADVLVCVSDNDEKNLLASLLAKQAGVKKVIARVSKENNIDLFEKVGVDVAVSYNNAILHDINNRLIMPHVMILASVEKGQGEVIEITIPKAFKQRQIKELRFPQKGIVAIIERRNRIIIPKGDTLVFPEDNLIIFTKRDSVDIIRNYLLNC